MIAAFVPWQIGLRRVLDHHDRFDPRRGIDQRAGNGDAELGRLARGHMTASRLAACNGREGLANPAHNVGAFDGDFTIE